MVFEIISISGFTLCCLFLILVRHCYAGIVSYLWYVINLLFWAGIGITKTRFIKSKKIIPTKVKLYCFIVGVFLFGIYLWKLPAYSSNKAIGVLYKEHTELNGKVARNPWQYRGFVDGSAYLIVFETNPLTAFLFDPYNGTYEEFNLAKRLPFIQ